MSFPTLPTLGDHSQPLNVQYLVHIAFVHINHTDQFKYSFKESSEVTGDHCKNNYIVSPITMLGALLVYKVQYLAAGGTAYISCVQYLAAGG